MFGPSVKSVPGWWVSIVPMLIGVPVALVPGLGPHEDTSAVVPPLPLVPVPAALDVAALELDVAALELVLPPLGAELLLELLLPHPASASSATAATDASPTRIRGMR
jgi:hypothetical protein